MRSEHGGAPLDWLRPPWDCDAVGALATTRSGGVSQGPFASMNVGDAVGDQPAKVAVNRERLLEALGGAQPAYLRQVHGSRVIELDASIRFDTAPEADASVTAVPGIACAVQTADCLPVLFAAPMARGVGAAHAGWRGLAGGVLEATVEALCRVSRSQPGELRAWLGPCIGPEKFEVGAEVVDALIDPSRGDDAATRACFRPRAANERRDGATPHAGKWRADLAGLARLRLAAAGIRHVSGGDLCTVSDASRFFSFRRDRVCGRMAAAVWLHQH